MRAVWREMLAALEPSMPLSDRKSSALGSFNSLTSGLRQLYIRGSKLNILPRSAYHCALKAQGKRPFSFTFSPAEQSQR